MDHQIDGGGWNLTKPKPVIIAAQIYCLLLCTQNCEQWEAKIDTARTSAAHVCSELVTNIRVVHACNAQAYELAR